MSDLVRVGLDRGRLQLAEACRLEAPEHALHDAVLAGVEGDDAEPAADGEQRGGLGESLAERPGLVVDGHAEGLEGARGNVGAA